MGAGAAEVYLRLAPGVLGYLRAERAPEPEDLLGEVFLQVARDLGRFSGDDDACRRWVFTIAHHRLVDDRRRRHARPQRTDAQVPDVADPRPADEAGLDPVLRGALAALTPDQREVVVLRFVADLSLEDTAGITGRTVGAVKSLQVRALDNLRKAVSLPA
ncbi:MAG: sigma-70 family RNA polymerase sigma factor [Acidimicrobiales bacterium]